MLPLDDLLVLDLSRVLAGPYCSMYLGDFGARVVKVERPGEGDDTRGFGPPFVGGESTYFMSVNRNKESVAIDFKQPRGRELLHRLAARADVLLENFRPGVLDRLGLGPGDALARNARLIYVSITGYGHAGLPEFRTRPGYDIIMQGEGGIPSLTGPPEGGPFRVGVAVADMVAGLYALTGTLLALRARTRTGRGQHVDVSLLDGQVSLLSYNAAIWFATGRDPDRMGNAHPSIVPYETFAARDGHLNIAAGNDALFRALCGAVGRPALAEDERFARNAARVHNRDALLAILRPLIAAHSVDHWLGEMDAAGIPCGRIATVGQALAHPQIQARDMVRTVQHPTAGPLRVTGVPVRLSATPGAVRTPPPRIGEHTQSALSELLELAPADLAALERDGIVAVCAAEAPPRP
jgi:formyl-CoA transferase/CoA:oxalate CoA-transferase